MGGSFHLELAVGVPLFSNVPQAYAFVPDRSDAIGLLGLFKARSRGFIDCDRPTMLLWIASRYFEEDERVE